MVDSKKLCEADDHDVRVKTFDGKIYEGHVEFYEPEYESGYDVASIGLSIGREFKETQIESIEIID